MAGGYYAPGAIQLHPLLLSDDRAKVGAVPDLLRFEYAATMATGAGADEATVTFATLTAGYGYAIRGVKVDTAFSSDASLTFQSLNPAATLALWQYETTNPVGTNSMQLIAERGILGDAFAASVSQAVFLTKSDEVGSLSVSIGAAAALTAGKVTIFVERLPLPDDLTVLNMGSYVVA